MFHFYTYFQRFFNIFLLDLFVCKFALDSFYTYFRRILTILQISIIFQTFPGPPQGASWTPPGPFPDPPRCAGTPFFAQETTIKQYQHHSSQQTEGMRVAHQAGTEPEFCQNVNGMEVAHPAGTEPEFVNDVDGMRVAH